MSQITRHISQLLGVLSFATLMTPAWGNGPEKVGKSPVVKVVGVEVRGNIAENLRYQIAFNAERNNDRAGLLVHLRLAIPKATIVDLRDQGSKLTQFEGNKECNLMLDDAGKPIDVATWLLRGGDDTRFTDEGACYVTVRSPRLPAAGTTKVHLRAVLACEVGLERKSEIVKPTASEEKETKVGPLRLRFQEKSCNVASDKPNLMIGLTWLDRDGNDVPTEHHGSGSSGVVFSLGVKAGGTTKTATTRSFHYYYSFRPQDEKCDAAAVRVSYFAKTKVVMVPVEVEIDLGLGR